METMHLLALANHDYAHVKNTYRSRSVSNFWKPGYALTHTWLNMQIYQLTQYTCV